ncbi:MAG: chorismate mutase [Candidatus Sericytochromatia bacterium]|nr:chorismate mutase [Candidatus Tanganyikabacteria bacterium]
MTGMPRLQAIRGAITVPANERQPILQATGELLGAILGANGLVADDIVSAIFTMTGDLDAVFPAEAARDIGWNQVPLLCCREIDVPGSLPRCVRVMVHVETPRDRAAIQHVYLREATRLRPDLSSPQ